MSKSSRIVRLFLSLVILVLLIAPASAQSDKVSQLLGDWNGESVCVNKEKFPACKDEVVVYHIKKVPDKPDTVNLSADKIVNGKPEFMGAFDFIYDAKKQILTSDFKNERVHFLLEFVVKGDVLEGSMTSLPDKTQVRRIKVKKDQK
jgi:hypothetical protein